MPIMGRDKYILGSNQRHLLNVVVRDPWVTTNHRVILEYLRGSGDRQNHRYQRDCTTWPIATLKGGGGAGLLHKVPRFLEGGHEPPEIR